MCDKKGITIVTHGGCGSSHLIETMRARIKTCFRIDTAFFPIGYPVVARGNNERQYVSSYNVMPTNESCKCFEKRTTLQIDEKTTIESNMINIWQQLQEKKQSEIAAVFVLAFHFDFFSKNNIKPDFFIIRRPIEMYGSYTRPERHEAFVNYFGGVNSDMAIEWFAKLWNDLVDEALITNSVILKYENPEEDVPAKFMWMFKKWKPNINPDLSHVHDKTIKKLAILTQANASKIYGY